MSGFKEERLMQGLLAPRSLKKATYIADKNEAGDFPRCQRRHQT